MGKLILFTLVLQGLQSCVTQRYAINPFIEKNYCFDDTLIGADKVIKLQGYYQCQNIWKSSKNVFETKFKFHVEKFIDTQIVNLCFFNNGLALLHFQLHSPSSGLLARYTIYEDTIKTIHTQTGGQTPGLQFQYYKIINDSTIHIIGRSSDIDLDSLGFEKFRKREIDTIDFYSHSKFIKLEALPNYNQQDVLKEKWFWCDPIKHQEFMFKNYPKK